jgi:uncharacterized protein YcbX
VRVSDIWRFPVKSMGGERLDAAEVTRTGIRGDRSHGIFDLASGTVLTGRRTPELLFASARLNGPTLADGIVVTLPGGAQLDTAVSEPGEIDRRLSDWLGRSVELRAAGAEGVTCECPMDFERDADWIEWQGPGGAWHDTARRRVTFVSTATLGAWDRRRFRANLVVDGGGEDDLVGSDVTIGSTTLEVDNRVDRCVMVTRPQPGLERDLDVLRTINRDRETCLSVGCTVTTPGTIAVGDEVVAAG